MNDIKSFIVHGHDELSKYKLKDYLQNTLHYPEPVILSEIAGQGRTVIESFEEESENAGLVFVSFFSFLAAVSRILVVPSFTSRWQCHAVDGICKRITN